MKSLVLKVSVLLMARWVLSACQKKEISLLNELKDKMNETKGDLALAKTVLKNFLQEKDQKIKDAVNDAIKQTQKLMAKKMQEMGGFPGLN